MAAIQGNWYASAGLTNEAYPQQDGTVRFVYADQPNGERYIVAKVWAGDDQDYEGTARLVAAAPDMHALLADFMLAMEGTCEFAMWDDGWQAIYLRCKKLLEGTNEPRGSMD